MLAVPTLASIREIITQAHDNGTDAVVGCERKIQARMSDHAGFICHADKVRRATRDALLLSEFVQRHGLAIKHVGEVAELFMWRHMALTSAAVLTQLTHYIDAGGGSRGAMHYSRQGWKFYSAIHEMVFVMPGAFVQSVLRIKKINYLFIIATVSFTSEKTPVVSFYYPRYLV